MTFRRWIKAAAVAPALSLAAAAPPATAAAGPSELRTKLGADVVVTAHPATGRVSFVGTQAGRPIRRAAGVPPSASAVGAARGFLRSAARDFGVSDQAAELRVSADRDAGRGRSSVRFSQQHRGVPVLGGELIVNVDRSGNVLSASGELSPDLEIGVKPNLSSTQARRIALAVTAKHERTGPATLAADLGELSIYDARLLDAGAPAARNLVWRFEVKSRIGEPIREVVLVDALTGAVTLKFNQVAEAKNRKICDANNTSAQLPCTTPIRTEGQAPVALQDANLAYDYSGDTYDFLSSRFGRDSIDGAGMQMISTVRYCDPDESCPFANAFWNGSQMTYGQDYASADDVVGHEFAHGVTEFSSHLLYYMQSGAINESLSDVFGELIDLTNGEGDDSAGVRWEMGEDLPIGAIRHMDDPTVDSNPDRMTSPFYETDPDMLDAGGVHTNSGVNNKAAFLMTDGGTFNGRTVTALGIEKVAQLYYELETTQLTSAGDYADMYRGLYQACQNLVGTFGFTSANCAEVSDATLATEMNLQPAAAPTVTASTCPSGQFAKYFFNDNLENPASGKWTAAPVTGTKNEWYYPQNTHPITGFDATYGTSGKFNFWGNDPGSDTGDETSDSAIAMTTGVTIPAGAIMTFQHSYQFEADFFDNYDGGVVEYSANGGAWTDAGPLFAAGGYPGTLGDTSPLAGRDAFVGRSNGYGSSRLNLSSLAGKSVRFRFRLASDQLVGDYGWFIDDIRMGTCGVDTVSPTIRPPVIGFRSNATLGTSTTGASLPTSVTWFVGADDRTLAEKLRYRLLRKVNGGATEVLTAWTTRRSVAAANLIPGAQYLYTIQVKDEAGNIGSTAAPAFTPTIRQETSGVITYTGTWLARAASATAYGGFVRPTTSAGAKASAIVSGQRMVGVVMPKAATLGSVQVCLRQGSTTIICQTVDLSPTTGLGPRRFVFVRNGLDPALSYRVEVTRQSGRAELDAVIVG